MGTKHISDQSRPSYMVRLHASFWAVYDQPWQNYFVTVARVIDGKVVYTYVPILLELYRTNPTVWPKGEIGTVSYS